MNVVRSGTRWYKPRHCSRVDIQIGKKIYYMKKIASALILWLLLMSSISKMGFAQNLNGLDNQLDSLWLKDDGLLNRITETYSDHVSTLIRQNLSTPKYARITANLPLDDNELSEYIIETSLLNYSEMLKVTPFVTSKYMMQYAKNNSICYLTFNKSYISVLKASGEYSETFNMNGEYLNDSMSDYYICRKLVSSVIDSEGINFLKDINRISEMLKEKGEVAVTDIKLLVLDYEHTILLLTCNDKEYIIQLYSGRFDSADGRIQKFKLYTAYEYVSEMTGNNLIKKEKNTYLTEAQSLQKKGLLYGNEKGLDLLKPLSRIEAAAILVRAMGEAADAPDKQTPTFIDVDSSHWGFESAEKACRLGIINGIDDNRFAPDENVTAEQFATMVLRAVGEKNFNWERSIDIMKEKGILSQAETETMDFFTRGDMAKIIYVTEEKGLLKK